MPPFRFARKSDQGSGRSGGIVEHNPNRQLPFGHSASMVHAGGSEFVGRHCPERQLPRGHWASDEHFLPVTCGSGLARPSIFAGEAAQSTPATAAKSKPHAAIVDRTRHLANETLARRRRLTRDHDVPRTPLTPPFTKNDAPRRIDNPRRGVSIKFRQRPTLPHGNRAVPSALEGLTSVFGMGTGGTPPI